MDTQRNYISDASKIATLAGEYAKDAGVPCPRLEDIKAAIADALPPRQKAPQESKVADLEVVPPAKSPTPPRARPARPGATAAPSLQPPRTVDADRALTAESETRIPGLSSLAF